MQLLKKNNRLVGNISLKNIDLINRNSNLGLTIWAKASMRTGVERFGLMADHAINRLNINRIENGTNEKLKNLIKMLTSIGFKQDRIAKQYFLMIVNYGENLIWSTI